MRLTHLDLDRYGPFTGRQLAFRPDAALHVVHGPNEAGKSSALAAITDLLYGFEARSPANFRHRYEDLRIGAEIQAKAGPPVRFYRRKRLKNSLTDAFDTPLDESLLATALEGISRDVFQAAFGLSQSSLREGARQMLAAQGEVGESLFAAASGLRTLVAVRTGLEGEADALFGARKKASRAFYEAMERYDSARKALKERSLRADDIREVEEGIAAQEALALALAERLRTAAAQRSRLDRARRIWPILGRLIQAEQALMASPVPTGLRDGLADEIDAALAKAEGARQARLRLAGETEQAREALAAIVVDEALLAASDAITTLGDERAVVAEAMRDLPRREEEAHDAALALDDLIHRLGQPDRATLAQLRPDDLTLGRVRDLAEQRRAAGQVAARSAEAAWRLRETVEALERQAGLHAGRSDPEPLRRALQAMRPALDEAAAQAEREAEFRRRSALFEERLARLSPGPAEPGVLWVWPEPGEDLIGDFERRFADLIHSLQHSEREVLRLEQVLAELEHALRLDDEQGDLLDPARLTAERGVRDALFEAVLRESDPVAVNDYRHAVTRADELADRRLSQAERLARRELALRERDKAHSDLQSALAQRGLQEEAQARLQGDWEDIFAALSCPAAEPARMRRFVSEVLHLRDERAALGQLETLVERGRQRLEAERPALQAMAEGIGIGDAARQSLPSLRRLVEDGLDRLEKGAREAYSLADRLTAERLELARLEREGQKAREELEALQSDWGRAVGAIGLEQDASAQDAVRASELWSTVQGRLNELGSLEHRIERMKANRERFAERARALGQALLADCPDDPGAAAAALVSKLAETQKAAVRRQAATEALRRHENLLEGAQAALADAQMALAGLASETGCEPAALEGFAASLRERLTLTHEIETARRDLLLQGDGLEEAVLRAEAGSVSADEAAGQVEAIQAEMAALADEDKQVALTLGDLRRRRLAVEREAGAAGAAQALEDARSDLEQIARDYLVLKGASLMIEAGLERQLRTEQGPLIAKAGALFATITEGGFAGIATLYDEGDRLRLAARRPDGGSVAIEGLSEGTRDQLYLSLRLANLEAMAARRDVPPFIGDDLVITFDEGRVAATLKVMAVTGSSLQKILFTHHRHVVDIARASLGDAVDIITLDGGREDGAA